VFNADSYAIHNYKLIILIKWPAMSSVDMTCMCFSVQLFLPFSKVYSQLESDLQKTEAITMIKGCKGNTTLEVLSLVQWPGGKYEFSTDEEIEQTLQVVGKSQQDNNKKLLQVYWLVY